MFDFSLRHHFYRLRSWLGRPRLVTQVMPVILSEETRCISPIFIVGMHRSGTSLLRRIVNSHSRIACPPETFFLTYFAAMLNDVHTYSGLRGLGVDLRIASTEIAAWASRYHEAYRLAHGKARWADKTPQYVTILPDLEKIFGPASRYVMVFRHPLDIVYSLSKRGWRFQDYHPNLVLNNAHYVVDQAKRMLDFRNAYPTRCHSVHYERLVTNPEFELRALFDFLDEPWEEAVLKYHEKEHGFGTEDPIVRGAKGFVRNFGNWRSLSDKDKAQIGPILRGTMESLGYSTEGDLPEV